MPDDTSPPTGDGLDVTRAAVSRPGDSRGPRVVTPSSQGGRSSGLSSSGAHLGRFEPGTIIGGRYRLVAILGRGGMGEVYLADDLALDQSVALKFLSGSFEADAGRVSQLRNEVRIARQVTHPNVCRVHDLGETDGHIFLTMEYIDGEDLSSVIKRVGRVPEDRGLELARQICAGVAAAHARGVLHRDLKPANVMLDADGRARITDFGIAVAGGAAAEGTAGTPAYMAPEQFTGHAASQASDVFALGLLLYELFTGKHAFPATSVTELARLHEFRGFALPGELVPGLSPVIERTILACLEPDPSDRPRSAFAVAAALPGTDPLAAALERGETPSPELVAAAGGEAATVTPLAGLLALAALVVALAVVLALADRALLVGLMPTDLGVDALADRGKTMARTLLPGVREANRVAGFEADREAQRWFFAVADPSTRRAALAAGAAPLLYFWQRTSPGWVVPGTGAPRPTATDPPLDVAGATLMKLDLQGRLIELAVVPFDDRGAGPPGAELDWAPFFEAAGLPRSAFVETAPALTPHRFADVRRAWTGRVPAMAHVDLRVEAASLRGRVVSFYVFGPWSPAPGPAPGAGAGADELVSFIATVIVLPLCLVGTAILAQRNLGKGRGDRRGAWRLATGVCGLSLAAWVLSADHVLSAPVELARLTAACGSALLSAASLGLLYLALEPHARRIWPQVLISWSRLIAGRFRDPMVGRDLLLGAVAGALMTAITFAHYELPGVLGWPPFRPAASNLAALLGTRAVAGGLVDHLLSALLNSLLGAAGLVLTRLVVRRRWPSYALATAAFSFLAARDQFQTGSLALDLALGAALVVLVLGTIFRFGLLAGLVAFFVHFVTMRTPLTLDPSRPYFETGFAVVSMIVVGAAVGFVMARAREPVLGRWPGDA